MLRDHLAPLRRRKLIDDWHDRRIVPGDRSDCEISRGRATAIQGVTGSIAIAIVSAGRQAGLLAEALERELVRTGHFAQAWSDAAALAVVIGEGFAEGMRQEVGARRSNACLEVIHAAAAAGITVLPVAIGKTPMPRVFRLSKDFRAVLRLQALTLNSEEDVPAVAARLVVAAASAGRLRASRGSVERRAFISYRREDSWYSASIVATALARQLGVRNVFFDIGSIDPGKDFAREISARVREATDVIIIVGPTYLAADRSGRRRLDNRDDFVRREIRLALAGRKRFHVVLAGDAVLPGKDELPSDIVKAFEGIEPHRFTDYRTAGSLADSILGGHPALTGLRSTDSVPARSPAEAWELFMMEAVPRLAEFGWVPSDKARSRGSPVMTRGDSEKYRFVLDLNHLELVLEEHGRNIAGWGVKRWIRRSRFPFSLDDADTDTMHLPDPFFEAMADPGAYLDRTGRSDLDIQPEPPKSLRWLDQFARAIAQPSQRALNEHAVELARIRARGGLRPLACVHRISLSEDARAQAVATDSVTGRVLVASSWGLKVINVADGATTAIGHCGDLTHVAVSRTGLVAVTHPNRRLSVCDRDGREIVKRRTPYSIWQRLGRHYYGEFRAVSWSRDERLIAVGASDCVWIYHLGDDTFHQLPIYRPDLSCSAAALFVPDSDDLIVLHVNDVWRTSATATAGPRLDTAAGSAYYDPTCTNQDYLKPSRAGFHPDCAAVSPDGALLALGGNDAQLVFVNAHSLMPIAMRVWHRPLVNSTSNGKVEALAFSPDGLQLASIANDDHLVVGDGRSGDPLAEGIISAWAKRSYSRHSRDVCWAADGSRIAVLTVDGRIEIYDSGRPCAAGTRRINRK